MEKSTGILILDDGSEWPAHGYGFEGSGIGELCFNTAMTGYQEIISDPSYAEQIIVFTFPHIGITGTNDEDNESDYPVARGIITRAIPTTPSNWRSKYSLESWLKKQKIVALYGIDTRSITKRIREFGACKAIINYKKDGAHDIPALKEKLGLWPGIINKDLTKKVTIKRATSIPLRKKSEKFPLKVAVLHFGAKSNILTCLNMFGLKVDLLPATTTFEELLNTKPNGVLLSNGPGDPSATNEFTEKVLKKLIFETKIPIFGICLGHQLLGLALGAKTIKMNHGHHGANHPVKNLKTGKVEITSMNHGFSIDANTLPSSINETHVSLFDGSNCGIDYPERKLFSVQYHPEASPGPHDSKYLFQNFYNLISSTQNE